MAALTLRWPDQARRPAHPARPGAARLAGARRAERPDSPARRALLRCSPRRRCSSWARWPRRCASARPPRAASSPTSSTRTRTTPTSARSTATSAPSTASRARRARTPTRSTVEEVMRMMARPRQLGGTTVLLQGGLNPAHPAGSSTRASCARRARRFPRHHAALLLGARDPPDGRGLGPHDPRRARGARRDAGQTTLPGGGAEILSDARAQADLGPRRAAPRRWLDVHREAHAVGMRSTATMMYGHVETRRGHPRAPRRRSARCRTRRGRGQRLHRVRAVVLQARQHAAGASGCARNAGPAQYLRMLAAARLYLDNFDHVQASWFSRGQEDRPDRAALRRRRLRRDALRGERAPGDRPREQTTVDEIRTLIREAGFTPAQRTTLYEILRVDEAPAAPEWAAAGVAPAPG